MRKVVLFSMLIQVTLRSFAQADVWQPAETSGFGDPQNHYVSEFEVFNGNIYCATGRIGTGTAQVRFSPTGNSSWTLVNFSSPSLHPSVKSFPSFGKTNLSGGIMWIGTGSGIGTRIYRTTDGLNFQGISRRGFNNNPGLITPSPNMIVFQGSGDTIPYLYAGGGSHGGTTNAEVWRIPYNSTDSMDWVRLIDFDTVATTITDTVDLISYWCVWNNKIYFATNGKGQIWESSDGINFAQNALAPFGQYGFAVPSQIVIACLQVFNDTLYASTTNKILGGQMYRTGDGINWEMVTNNAFGKGNTCEELHNMDTAFGFIWVTAYTDTATSVGCPIWRSSDGINFIQSNTDGFGDPLINGQNPVTIGFGNHMYFGGPNYVNGAQIWRTDMTTGIDPSLNNCCSINIFPNPCTTQATIETDISLANATLTLINCFGEPVMQLNHLHGQSIIFTRDHLPAGLYFVRITQDDQTIATKKLLIAN